MEGINGNRPGESKKRITVSLLEAYFNALPHLINYVNKMSHMGDIEAKIAINNFTVDSLKEVPRLDPAEAAFGMIATLISSEHFPELPEKETMALVAQKFCAVNNLGTPADGYGKKLVIPSIGEFFNG